MSASVLPAPLAEHAAEPIPGAPPVRATVRPTTREALAEVVAACSADGLAVPLLATQILWINLVTDGLPTQGSSPPSATTVSAEERLRHFERAARSVPSGVPVNTILLPMEGDAWAAAAYWKLAVQTRGSFMTPARDWP